VSLNENCEDKAYLLGRLFAVLEKAQIDSKKPKGEEAKMPNKTVTDKFFSSACSTPASIFPRLIKLSKYHMSNSEYGFISEQRIQRILDMLKVENDPYPTHLSVIDQGIFILGYYHQKNDFYKKKEN
jgi:CRISPR-associated protein Csd1